MPISKLKKFITPKDYVILYDSVDNLDILDDKLIYRIETGYFSENNPQNSTGIFYVDIENRKITGMVFIYSEDEILADLETIDEYRNNGIGTQLVKDAISLGAKYLAVDKKNKIAINIYKKCGFKEYYFDEDENLCYMSLSGQPHPDDIDLLNNKM